MNCEHCKKHIIATTQIMWRGYPFHPDCMGEAVAQYRAQTDGIPEDIRQSLDEEEFFEDEITQYEENDDLEDLVERFDNIPDVDDEILNQIPPYRGDNLAPETSLPPDVIAQVRKGNGQVGTLISGRETSLVTRDFLKTLPTPQATDTFKPIPHIQLVEEIHKSLSYRRLEVVREEYAVSPDGMKCFGLLELNVEYAGVRFAIGLRNANDKSMRVGLVAGYKVLVCENRMLTGDFKPLLAKHSKNFNLIEGLSIALDKIHRGIGEVNQGIERKKISFLTEEKAMQLIYNAFMVKKLPMSLMRSVHQEYFVKPSFEEFSEKNVWSLENSFTTALKKLKPMQQFEATAKLGNIISQHIPA